MQQIVQHWMDALLERMDLTTAHTDGADLWAVFGVIVVVTLLLWALCRLLLMRGVRRLVLQTKAKWDDLVFDERVLRSLCHLIIPVMLYIFLPLAFPRHLHTYHLLSRVLLIYLSIVVFRLVNAMLFAAFEIASTRPLWRNKPIKGLRQTGQGIALLICMIFVLSILIDKAPTILLTGLGASAAVIMLIFRDSILGFVSGIQLAANDMLQVGDWISIPKYDADGTVEEVSLSTVKIRNWDNTVTTVPPYLLVSDSFQNWRAMQQSGGRRVKRSVSLDMTSVRFCTPEMLDKYRGIALLKEYIERTENRVEACNTKHGLTPQDSIINGLHQTNLGVLRAYLTAYLRDQRRINQTMTLMVRQLQPTETGLPMELYFFTDTVDWIAYEAIQSDIFDHVLAVIPEFDLRVFQNPSGADLQSLRPPT